MEVTDKFIAVIFAALIAGTISLLIYVLDRSKEISKARKEWIEGLRDDISMFLGNTTTIARLWEVKPKYESLSDFRVKHKEMYANAKTAYHKALLHLNQDEEKQKEREKDLRESLKTFFKAFFGKDETCSSESLSLADPVRKSAKRLFEEEWNKVKEGEPIYRHVKAGAVGLILGIIPPLALVWLIWVKVLLELGTVWCFYIIYTFGAGLVYWLIKR